MRLTTFVAAFMAGLVAIVQANNAGMFSHPHSHSTANITTSPRYQHFH